MNSDPDHFLDLHYLELCLQVASTCDYSLDDTIDDDTHSSKLLHPLPLKMPLQVLTIENLEREGEEEGEGGGGGEGGGEERREYPGGNLYTYVCMYI